MSDWQNNDATVQRVKELLLQAGIPLEMQVSEICSTFISRYDITRMRSEEKWRELHMYAGRTIYTHKGQQTVEREIDQVVEMYSEVKLMEDINIRIRTCIAIECKHRENLEVFGFPYPSQSSLSFCLPTVSELTPFDQWRHLMNIPRGNEPSNLSKEPLCSICLLQIAGGKTPQKVYDENLIYKSGAAVCDYIMAFPLNSFQELAELYLKQLGLLERFKTEYGKNYYGGEDRIINKWEEGVFRHFNSLQGGFTITQYLPVVCLDAPIYLADFQNGEINSFILKPYLKTDLILSNWPDSHKLFLQNPRAKPIILVTNVDNLHSVLRNSLNWHRRVKQTLLRFSRSNPNDTLRWPLRSILTRFWRKQVGYEP